MTVEKKVNSIIDKWLTNFKNTSSFPHKHSLALRNLQVNDMYCMHIMEFSTEP